MTGHLPHWVLGRVWSNEQLKMDFAINAFLILAFCSIHKVKEVHFLFRKKIFTLEIL